VFALELKSRASEPVLHPHRVPPQAIRAVVGAEVSTETFGQFDHDDLPGLRSLNLAAISDEKVGAPGWPPFVSVNEDFIEGSPQQME
jgi:hypothetical protein